jgi:hypothetical protein
MPSSNQLKDSASNSVLSFTNQAVTNSIDSTVPTLSSVTVEDITPASIILTYNEALNTSSIPANGDFAVSGGKVVTSVTISGTTVNVNLNSGYILGDTITISYTSGTNKIKDVAGNNVANLSSQAVTNNITPPALSSAVVQESAPTQIVLTYNDTLDSGSVPSTSAFTVSGGKTVSNVAISGSTVTITVNSAYTIGNAITISYTAGVNPIQDIAGNDAVNLSSQPVTNNTGSPSSLSGLVWWLKSDSITGLNNNDPVSTWNDSSSSAINLTGTGTTRPLYKTNMKNGKPAVVFDGVDDILTSSTQTLTAQTWFLVYKYTGAPSLKVMGGKSAASYFGLTNTGAQRKLIFSYNTGAQVDNAIVGVFDSTYNIEVYTRDGTGAATAFVNGSSAVMSLAQSTTQSNLIGDLGGISGFSTAFKLLELIVYNRQLDSTERGQITTYLNTKYAIF